MPDKDTLFNTMRQESKAKPLLCDTRLLSPQAWDKGSNRRIIAQYRADHPSVSIA